MTTSDPEGVPVWPATGRPITDADVAARRDDHVRAAPIEPTSVTLNEVRADRDAGWLAQARADADAARGEDLNATPDAWGPDGIAFDPGRVPMDVRPVNLDDDEPTSVPELNVATATGVWAVRSEGSTVYYADLSRGRLLRQPGEGSPTGAWDGVWVPLVRVACDDGEAGKVRLGHRHRWTTDPDGGAFDLRWWVQRRCTAIEPVPADAVPDGRPLGSDQCG